MKEKNLSILHFYAGKRQESEVGLSSNSSV